MRIGEPARGSPANLFARTGVLKCTSRAFSWSGITLVGALIAIGIALRLTYYLLNPSLSVDEAALALNLLDRSYTGLFNQLDFAQAAPAGFLVLQKLAIAAFGASPYVLRLLPLTAGITALILFYPVAKRLVGEHVAILALVVFTISDALLTYSATNKPYSLDVAVTLALYAVVLTLPDQAGWRGALVLTASGTIALLLSYAATFVLAAIGSVLLIDALRARRPRELGGISAAIVVWLGTFAATYSLTHSSVAQIQRTIARNQPAPLGVGQPGHPGLLQTYGGIVRFLFGIPTLGHGIRSAMALIAVALAFVGVAVLAGKRRRALALLLIPGVVALVAAAADRYVLAPRTFLFLIPCLAILAAQGAFSLMATNRAPAIALGAAAFAILIVAGGYAVIDHLGSRRQTTFVRVLRYLTQHARSGDSLYVHVSAQPDFRYYLECGCFGTAESVRKARALWPLRPPTSDINFMASASPRLVAGESLSTVAADYRSELAPFRGRKRVWVLVINPSFDSPRALANFLHSHGTRTGVFPPFNPPPTASVATGVPTAIASVALYDLR